MRSHFAEFYKNDEIDEIWENGRIIFDTNVLLSAYGLTSDARNKLFEIMNIVKNQLIMPYQVGHEYFRNRLNKIDSYIDSYKKINMEITKTLKSLINESNFSLIKSDEKTIHNISSVINSAMKDIDAIFDSAKDESLPQEIRKINEDFILETYLTIFEDKVSSGFNKNELERIYTEGELRYSRKVPPGYEDLKSKSVPDCYGDLVIWKEIISISKKNKADIIFVTNDTKKDWWLEYKGVKQPRPELSREFSLETGYGFEMYTYKEFVREAAKRYKIEATEQLQEQAKILETEETENNIRIPEVGDIYYGGGYFSGDLQEYLIYENIDNETYLAAPFTTGIRVEHIPYPKVGIGGKMAAVLINETVKIRRIDLIKFIDRLSEYSLIELNDFLQKNSSNKKIK
ncbi:hypothetical protein D3C76_242860 [compost metagenome]